MTAVPASTSTEQPVVALRSGRVSYDGHPALIDIDLVVRPGEVVAVLGANGSGKSTLVRAIVGLVPLETGSLELFGTPSAQFRDRARIGFVPQRHTVGGGVTATVEEVVGSGRLPRRRLWRPWLSATDRAVIAEAIATVGLSEKAHQPVSTLSGGQQRRVLIARALASQPELLVMDEPFAGVDHANQEILAATLGKLNAEGMTLLLVTHELGPVTSLVRRTVVLHHGGLVYDGPPTREVLDRFGAADAHPHSPPHEPGPEGFGLSR
ncbi:metal ABC transporter ATP-binding protein [Thermasporomyces composti]|uniref:Zinc transport system ATP-binding protein n=1 Tax=Thermasporomyces composti TaxID=696763 RepID=A0A3D9VF93_THECX|nr:ABC transporter ATP-binding protein [Thermasporomyces composti]REF37815.1 zinc transport system ATP-binding protein [Thermasporomyces composti]